MSAFLYLLKQMYTVIYITLFVAAVFYGLFFLAKKHPFTASLLALVIYTAAAVLDLVVAPKETLLTLPVKLIIIFFLFRATTAALKLQDEKEDV